MSVYDSTLKDQNVLEKQSKMRHNFGFQFIKELLWMKDEVLYDLN